MLSFDGIFRDLLFLMNLINLTSFRIVTNNFECFQVMDRQQYIVRPMVMDETTTNGSGSENPAVAGSSGVVSEAALEHAPTLTEETLRERGIPLHQAIQQVRLYIPFLFSPSNKE